MAAELSGPRLEPKSRRPARQLVVFLHGYGADGNDLIDIGRAWADLLPDAAFVSPHAPELLEGAVTGRQWFRLTYRRSERALARRQRGRAGAGTLPRRRAGAARAAAGGARARRLQPSAR
jgi:predicted esterase